MVSNKQMCELFFTNAGDKTFKCNLCSNSYKQDTTKGYGNLVIHMEKAHPDWKSQIPSGSATLNFPVTSGVSKKAKNIYGWLDWIISEGHPFSMVEKEKTKKYSNLDPISRPTFMKFMDLVTKEVEKKVSEKLGIIIDGWSDMSTSSYYLGVFACFRHKEVTDCPLLTFSALNNEVDHTAENQVKFLEDVLAIYGRSRKSLALMVSDNERTNKKIADIFGLNMIGCFSHRLNLAVKMFLGEYSVIIQKVHSLMKKLTI